MVPKSEGSGEAGIQIAIELSAGGSGRSFIQMPDGSEVERPDNQSFVKIEKERLANGDWLLNAMTNELHRVLGVLTDPRGNVQVKLSTKDGYVLVPWEAVPETLLLVVNT